MSASKGCRRDFEPQFRRDVGISRGEYVRSQTVSRQVGAACRCLAMVCMDLATQAFITSAVPSEPT